MKILTINQKLGIAKVVVETLEDLWHLSNILENGDKISSSTFRVVKFGDKEERKPVFITLGLEDSEFDKSVNRLRLRGKILSGHPEDFVQLGRYHTIEVTLQDKIEIQKEWKSFHIKQLKDAEKESKRPLVFILVLDDEKAITATLRGYGIEYGPEFSNSGSKKSDDYDEKMLQYFGNILAYIEKHTNKIIIAGPGFAKDNFKKFISQKNPTFLKNIVFETCSYAERTGVNELMKRGVIEKIAGEQRLEKEEKLIEDFIRELNKNTGLVAYGTEAVELAISSSAVSKLLILDELLRSDKKVQSLAEQAEKLRAELIIFSKETEPGIKLKSFSGIAAILRFSIS